MAVMGIFFLWQFIAFICIFCYNYFWKIRGGRIVKKLIRLSGIIMCLLIVNIFMVNNVFAVSFDENKEYIIDDITSKAYPVELDVNFINQLKNYLYKDDVDVNAYQARYFVKMLAKARQADLKAKTTKERNDVFVKYNDAFAALGLKYEYDSATRNSYYIDSMGRIVIDKSPAIKSTGEDLKYIKDGMPEKYGFFLAGIIALIVAVVALRIGKRKSLEMYAHSTYEPIQVKEKVGRVKPKNYTINYFKMVQVLKYFYYPFLIAAVACMIFYIGYKNSDSYALINSIKANMLNSQPIYIDDDTKFEPSQGNENEKTLLAKNVVMPSNGQQYGLLKSDKNGINAPIYMGDRYEYFEKGAGTYPGSMLPGFNGTTLIGAHNTLYFNGLKSVKKNDDFTFITTYGIYKYKVLNKFVVKNNYDKAYNLKASGDSLILYTCYPFEKFKGNKNDRLFVYLKKVSGPSIYLGNN